jgi:hypothetical protein
MSPIEELSGLLSGPSRVIVIARRDVNLQSLAGKNDLILLKMAEGSLAAGGRGGGFGERRVVMVAHFRYRDGLCQKLFETIDEGKAAQFEVPYYVARMPLTLRDGTDAMGYGVVDEDAVSEMISKIPQPSSA